MSLTLTPTLTFTFALALALALAQKLLDKKETIESLKAKGFRGSFFNTEDRERASFFDLGTMGADGRVANERSSFRGSFFGGSSLGRLLLVAGRRQSALDSLGTVSKRNLRAHLKTLVRSLLLLTGRTHEHTCARTRPHTLAHAHTRTQRVSAFPSCITITHHPGLGAR